MNAAGIEQRKKPIRIETWQTILTKPATGQHIAQTYKEESFLIKAVALFAGTGLTNGEGVLLVATKPHLIAFAEKLKDLGHDVIAAKARGQLVELPSDEVLAQVMLNGFPDPVAFKGLAEAAIQKTQGKHPSRGVRIFGELVNVLWLAGSLPGAMAIEALWDEIGRKHPFVLFCGYHMDPLDKTNGSGPFQSVCHSHSHVIPAEDYDHFETALTQSSHEILGPSLASMVRRFAGGGATAAQMPPAQVMLLWLRAHMPVAAEKVAVRTRVHYQPLTAAAEIA